MAGNPPFNQENFIYVDSAASLGAAAGEWRQAKELGVDLECENNLHHYGVKISLIQLSTKGQSWIVDVIALREIGPLLAVFEDRNIQKIFHDVSFDLRILLKQFSCRPKNVYDTQLACLLLGKKDLGLTELLADYFGVEKKHKFQKADWTRRPIPKEMLSYATNDTKYLIKLRDILNAELENKGRVQWMEEECAEIENRDFSYPEPDFFSMKGLKMMPDRQRGTLFRLYNLREKLAKMVNRPVHFIINNKMLVSLSKDPPKTIEGWMNLRGVHPVVRSRARDFFGEANKGKTDSVRLPHIQKKRYSPEERAKIEHLTEKRNTAAEKIGIQGYLILSNEQMQKIALTGNTSSLRPWQKRLLGM